MNSTRTNFFAISFFLISSISLGSSEKIVDQNNLETKNELVFLPKFYIGVPVSQLDSKFGPICRKKFLSLCKKEDLPELKVFSQCLQKNFNSFESEVGCGPLAHALINLSFLTNSVRDISQCAVLIDQCEATGNTDTLKCLKAHTKLPGVCAKLMFDMVSYRKILSIYYGVPLNK